MGTTVDLASRTVGWELIEPFGATPEGKWLAANAHKYGFALSYPASAEAVTGYVYEPWRIRYVGNACSNKLQADGQPLIRFPDSLAPEGQSDAPAGSDSTELHAVRASLPFPPAGGTLKYAEGHREVD